tara:strand:- start:378 stop:554 length:177 start_codon:yes stop_codon:yes gene_type:complete
LGSHFSKSILYLKLTFKFIDNLKTVIDFKPNSDYLSLRNAQLVDFLQKNVKPLLYYQF